jgi:glycosyltransferase involved in cell wall biosynthesis
MRTVVLYAHDLDPETPTGIAHYFRHIIRGILETDTSEVGITYRVGASPNPSGTHRPPPEVPVLRLPWPRKALHLAWSASRRPLADRALGRPDLIHVLAPFTRVPSQARVVYTVHDLWPLTSPAWYSRKERWMFEKAIGDATRRATLLIADSQATADQVTTRLGVETSRIRVVHLAVDDIFFRAPDPGEVDRVCRTHQLEPGRYLIVVGSVSTRKNLRPVVEALAQMTHRSPPVTLVAAGPPGIGFEATQQLVRQRGLEATVRFTGWLPREDLPPLVSGAAGLLHPSADEGFGLTPLEAMACGVPTAVSNAGALPEVCGDAAILVDPHDPDAWAEAISRLLEDDDLRATLIDRGCTRAAGFRWHRVASETIAVHRAALDF